jgi:hypothetical protein
LGGAVGTLLGGVLARIGLAEADAAPKNKKKPSVAACRNVGQSCRKPRNRPRPRCCGGTRCNGNRCVCRQGFERCGNDCIRRNQCCRDNQCPGDQPCINNRCGCPQGRKLCEGQCIADAAICVKRVTPNSLKGWIPFGEDAFSQDPSLTTFVNGPGTPPIGTGSVNLDPQAFGAFPEDGTQAVLRTLQYAGTRIADIARLGYYIFVPAGGDPPTMQLAVTGANTGEPSGFMSIVYVPGANGNPAVPDGTWTAQAPMDGFWFLTRDVFGSGGECLICRGNNTNYTGTCAVPGACTGRIDVSWDTIVAANPNAIINGTNAGEGGFSLRIGRGDTGEGNVDGVVFNNDAYDFDPA